MNTTTFLTNATLSIATVYAFNVPLVETPSISSVVYVTKQSTNSTYKPSVESSSIEDIENLQILTEFTDELLKDSKPLDDDISQLINENIMDLLS